MDTQQQPPRQAPVPGPRRTHRRAPFVVGLAAAAAVATVAVLTRGGGDPTVLTVPPADVSAMCAVITPEQLAPHRTAFEGRVTDVSDDRVTLEVTRTFAGDVGDTVEVPQQASDLPGELAIAPLEQGTTYLISADDGRVVACGQSGPVSPELLALYEQAFPG